MRHTDKHYEIELTKLKDLILEAGSIVESMIANSMKSMVERNSGLAAETIRQDAAVNRLEIAIDELCIQLLALRQPAASDLRFITIGLRISKDLERMGDLAVNIAEQAIDLNKEPPLKPYVDLPKMAARAQEMVKSALDSFVKRDAVAADKICEMDDYVDELNDTIFKELLEFMQKDSTVVQRATRVILVSRQLERIADHATNIAEEVVFMVSGKDIRHGGRKTA